jgi:predicted nuclease with RNAse H fold
VHVLGIDLAARPATTGVVVLEPVGAGRWSARSVGSPADDDLLVELARDALAVGVDAPLGWPDAFVDAVTAHHGFRPWPAAIDRAPLTHRETDRRTRAITGRLPLSVSADLLGVVAMRCALLQRRWADEVWGAPEPRDGSGVLGETYPAAAFAVWGIEARGYKARQRPQAASEVRSSIVRELRSRTDRWLDLDAVDEECVASDHVLDALVCAIVAVAMSRGATEAPPTGLVETARREGWIRVPTCPLGEVVAPR